MSAVEKNKANKKSRRNEQKQVIKNSNNSHRIIRDNIKKSSSIIAHKKSVSLKKMRKFMGSREMMKTMSATTSIENTDQTTVNEDDAAETTTEKLISSPNGSSRMPRNGSREVPEKAPPTHFVSVTVSYPCHLWTQFFEFFAVNRNMVITEVQRCFLHLFIPGDQISGINGTPLWSREDLDREFQKQHKIIALSVIRAWNLKCLTESQVEQVVPQVAAIKQQYFSVTVYCNGKASGLNLYTARKKVYVRSIQANTPVSGALLVGDQILCVNNKILDNKSKKRIRKKKFDLVLPNKRKNGVIRIVACRPIGPRCSPAPSLEAEIAENFVGYAIGVEKGTKTEKRVDDVMTWPLDADALEIAMRELTFLQQWIDLKSDNIPIIDRGASLLVTSAATIGSREGASHFSCFATSPTAHLTTVTPPMRKTSCSALTNPSHMGQAPLTGPGAHPSTHQVPEVAKPLSVPSVVAPTTVTTMQAVSPAFGEDVNKEKEVGNEGSARVPRKNSETPPVTFAEHLEFSNITSDVPEETELSKCDLKSGMIAYIRNKWRNN